MGSYHRIALAGALALAVSVANAGSPDYPSKPLRIVTSGTGGSNDFAARMVAINLTAALGQNVIVENKGGASAVVPAHTVARANPDGYTLLSFSSPLWLLPYLQDAVPYDPIRDFTPITISVTSPNVLVVHPSLPVKSVADLIALAKSRPGELNYASTTTGGPNHLSAELFKAMAGVNIVRISYKDAGQSVNDLINRRVELAFPSATAVAPHVKSGRLKALAVTSSQPSVVFAGLPTVAASGLPGYESVLVVGVFAPAGTPAPIVTRLNQEIVKILHRADVKEKFLNVGVETVGSTPAEFSTLISSEMARMGKVIREAGIRGD